MREDNAPGLVRDILNEGLSPLACHCGCPAMGMGSGNKGEFLKLVCIGCGQVSAAMVPMKRQKLLTNGSQKAAQMGVEDSELTDEMTEDDTGDGEEWLN